MYIVLPKDYPEEAAHLTDAELEMVAGGFLNPQANVLNIQDPI